MPRSTETMQRLIASYLFQNNTCPLPGLGTFSIHKTAAEADFTNRIIAAPKPVIQFINTESNADGLVAYVAFSSGKSPQAAADALNQYCDDLKHKLYEAPGVTLDEVGSLFVDANGWINFRQEELPESFLQSVTAERMIHPQSEHQILVGDKETTNTVMTELLTPKTAAKDRWWIWAIVLGTVGVLLLLIYFSGSNYAALLGNTTKI